MDRTKINLKLLPSDSLVKTGDVDHADWNYRFILGGIQKERFKLILKLMGNNKYNNLLEIGYGSGIFIPHLAEISQNYYGIDLHNKNEYLMNLLLKYGIKANLYCIVNDKIPFESNFFDAVIAVSTLEFIENLNTMCFEIRRVLKENGHFYVVTPGHTKFLDLGLKVLTGKSAKKDYGDKREKVIPALIQHFTILKRISFPKNNFGLKFYDALCLTTK